MAPPARAEALLFSSGRRHTSCLSDWSSDVCSSDLVPPRPEGAFVSGAPSDRGGIRLAHDRPGNRSLLRLPPDDTQRLRPAPDRSRRYAAEPLRSEERRVGNEGSSRGSTERSTNTAW